MSGQTTALLVYQGFKEKNLDVCTKGQFSAAGVCSVYPLLLCPTCGLLNLLLFLPNCHNHSSLPASPDYSLFLVLLFHPQIAGHCALGYGVSEIVFFMPPQVVAPCSLETSFPFLWFIIVLSIHYCITFPMLWSLHCAGSAVHYLKLVHSLTDYRCAKAEHFCLLSNCVNPCLAVSKVKYNFCRV